MIDLHTHILCGMDDGAPDADTSLRMLRQEQEQGVDTVVLTPHFYRSREDSERFLHRRRAALDQLEARLAEEPDREELPRMVLGAEVAWMPNLAECRQLDKLCLGDTRYLLLELPYTKWDSALVDQIYDLMGRTGLTPVLAHFDRYRRGQQASQLQEMLSLDVPVQMSSDTFLRFTTRGSGLRAMQQYAHVVASDCHDPVHRKPDLGDAMVILQNKLGKEAAMTIIRNARSLAGV